MKTYLECLPCFLNQALRAGKMASDKEEVVRNIMNSTAASIPGLDMNLSPAENGMQVYEDVFKQTGVEDPYREIKRKHIADALAILPELESIVEQSSDPLLTAIRIAIAGNVIDLGYPISLTYWKMLKRYLNKILVFLIMNSLKKNSRSLLPYCIWVTMPANRFLTDCLLKF